MKTTLTPAKTSLMLMTLGLITLNAAAQPDLGAAKGANPPNRTPGQLMRDMAPEQRRAQMQGRMTEMLQERRAEMLRQSLTQGGFEDKATQDAVVEFANQQIKAALALREKASKVSEVAADKAATDAQISALLNDLHAAQVDEKGRRETAEKTLDAKINYSQKPRLEALLTSLNLIGEGSGGLMNMMGGLTGGRGMAVLGGRGGALGGDQGAAGGFAGGIGRGGQNGFGAGQGGAFGGAARGADRGGAGGFGGFGGGRRAFGGAGGFGGQNGFGGGGFGGNQNGAPGDGQNAAGNARGGDIFGLRRERGLRREQRDAAGKAEGQTNKDDKTAAKPAAKVDA